MKKSKNGIYNKTIMLAVFFLCAVMFMNSYVNDDPCDDDAQSYQCLDQGLKLAVKKNNEHRSGEK